MCIKCDDAKLWPNLCCGNKIETIFTQIKTLGHRLVWKLIFFLKILISLNNIRKIKRNNSLVQSCMQLKTAGYNAQFLFLMHFLVIFQRGSCSS